MPPILKPPCVDCILLVKWEIMGYPALLVVSDGRARLTYFRHLQQRNQSDTKNSEAAEIRQASVSQKAATRIVCSVPAGVWIM
jgi:hypothetical protein